MAWTVGAMKVDIKGDDSKLQGKLTGIRNQLGTWSVAVGTATGSLIVRALETAVGATIGRVKSAMDLEETVDKLNRVMGTAAEPVKAMADMMAKDFGHAKGEIMDGAAMFSIFGKQAGLAEQDLAAFSMRLVKVADGAASAFNASMGDTIDAFMAALRNETDPIEKYGVLINENAMKQYMLAHGITKSIEAMTNQEKIMLRARMITEQLAWAENNRAETLGGATNQFRLFAGQLMNMGETLAAAFLPALTSVIAKGNEFLKSFFEPMGVLVRNWRDYWEIIKLSAYEKIVNVIEYAKWFGTSAYEIISWVGRNWREIFADTVEAIRVMVVNLGMNLANLANSIMEFAFTGTWEFDWTPMLDGFEATVKELPNILAPELTDMGDQINALMEGVAKRESDRAAKMADERAKINEMLKGGLDGKGGAAGEGKSEAGKRTSITEFANSIQEGVFGKGKVWNDQLKVQQDMRAQLREMNAAMRQRAFEALALAAP